MNVMTHLDLTNVSGDSGSTHDAGRIAGKVKWDQSSKASSAAGDRL